MTSHHHSRMRVRYVLPALIPLLGLAGPAAAKECAELAQLALPDGKVTSAELVAAGAFKQAGPPPPPGVAATSYAGLPEFCRVRATLTPTTDSDIKVEVWLPAKGWNGKFVGIGNGIWAGQISYAQLGQPLSRGYVAASTDTGHAGTGLDAEFADGHHEKLVDFGHRAVHLMTVTAKQVAAGYYGSAPKLSFWNSCSTGGRQGLMEAYRYPEDYDAISAMAPANPMTDLMTQSVWTGYQANRAPGAKLTPAKLAALHKAYVAACDPKDGLKDGLVGAPEACAFDPAAIACKDGDGDGCLTPVQVETMRAVYRGPPGLRGFPTGSEVQMAALMSGPEPFPVANSYMKLLVFKDRKWDFRTFDYGKDAQRARDAEGAVLDVPSDGLGKFFGRGGKLLLSHGWTDGLIPANNTVAFYGRLKGKLSARQQKEQLRLFMVPGMDHCAGGEGPFLFDTLEVVDQWASTGTAPERIVASRPPGPNAVERPLCPYPQTARYDGAGDVAKAASFACAKPK